MGVGRSADRFARLAHHLAADIHRINFTEKARESARHPPCAAADFKHSHLLGIAALADVGKVVENLFFQRDLAGLEELLVRPLVLGR